MTTQLLLTDAPTVDLHAGERARIEAVIRDTARAHDGRVSQNVVRDRLGTVARHGLVGRVYQTLRQRGLLVEDGHERSTDTRGGNAGKWVTLYTWGGAL